MYARAVSLQLWAYGLWLPRQRLQGSITKVLK
jgi:hypothetical protein